MARADSLFAKRNRLAAWKRERDENGPMAEHAPTVIAALEREIEAAMAERENGR